MSFCMSPLLKQALCGINIYVTISPFLALKGPTTNSYTAYFLAHWKACQSNHELVQWKMPRNICNQNFSI